MLDLIALDQQTLLAAKVLTQASWDTVSLFRSHDAGDSRHPFQKTVLDALGRTVAALVHGPLESGPHRIPFAARGLKAGIYFGRLQVGGRVATLKLLHWE